MSSFDDGYDSVIHFPGGTSPPVSLRETLRSFEKQLPSLDPASLRPIPTGFPELDANMGGGLHTEDLVLVVGRQNVGKTLFVSQIARNIARWAAIERNRVVCLMVCYEHSPMLLQQRLLCLESCLASGDSGRGVSLDEIRGAMVSLSGDQTLRDLSSVFLQLPRSALAGWQEMEKYLDALYLYRGDPVYTSPEALEKMVVVLRRQGLMPVLIVDYLQRVPLPPELVGLTPNRHIDYVVRSLKGLALRRGIPVIAVGAVDEPAVRRPGPVRFEDLWGPVTVVYEPDVAWVMNREETAGFTSQVERVRMTIEKNRRGAVGINHVYSLLGSTFCLA